MFGSAFHLHNMKKWRWRATLPTFRMIVVNEQQKRPSSWVTRVYI